MIDVTADPPMTPARRSKGMTFGEWMHAARKFHGFTLQEVADRAGLSKAHVWETEQGRTQPTLPTAESIANALGTDLWRALKRMKGK